MRIDFTIYDAIKRTISSSLSIKEIPTDPFFSHPNNISDYDLNIRYGSFSRKIIKLSPFSRFGRGIVDHKSSSILFSSFKAGSSTIRHFAQFDLGLRKANAPLESGKRVLSFDEAQVIDFPYLTNLVHPVTSENIKNRTIRWNNYADYKKYMVLRDPFERLISFFSHKFLVLQRDHVGTGKFTRSYILMNFAHLFRGIDVNIYDLTFEQFIDVLFFRFSNHQKLWDEHIGLQITPDFEEIAAKNVTFFDLPNMNKLLNQVLSNRGDAPRNMGLWENRTSHENAIYVDNAHRKTLFELSKIELPIDFRSFHDEDLVQKVKKIYASDYYWYNQISNSK